MTPWLHQLRFDPLPSLLAADSAALRYFARRDLLGERPGPLRQVWQLPEPQKILRRQLPDGSWPRSGAKKHPAINYGLIETWRQFRVLVEQYGFTRAHPQARRAAEFLFACQTPAGDIRGMLANQYATYYTGAILALLIQAGYAADPRLERGLQWLLSMRQDDGAWTVPLQTHKLDRATLYRLTSQHAAPLEPDRARPFAHNATGMVLRAFAVHPRHRRSAAARAAGRLLKSRFFQPDSYSSYRAASYWVRFDYPFWWNNLVSALDSLSRLGCAPHDGQMQLGLRWLIEHQQPSGLWRDTYAQPPGPETARVRERQQWVTLAICRVFKRLYG